MVGNFSFLSHWSVAQLRTTISWLANRNKQSEPLKYLQAADIEHIFTNAETMAQATLLLDSLRASGDIGELYRNGVNPSIEW